MLMFNFHIAFSLGLIALSFGAALLIWSKVHKSVGTALPKGIAHFIIIISALNLLCTGYTAAKHFYAVYSGKPCPMMMQDQMMQRPMMSETMMKDQGGKNQMMPQKSQNNR